MDTAVENGEDASTDGQVVGEEFLGRTGAAISERLTALGSDLDAAAEEARSFQMQAMAAAAAVRSAKSAIRLTVKTANPQIATAKEQEDAGEEPDPSAETLIDNARSEIQATMAG